MKKKDDRKRVVVGGIIKHNRGTGFKITFSDVEAARWYKEMFIFILKDDMANVRVEKGYYDTKENNE